ncbi:Hypothetical_protein [Hexamita inflata]|uniref:Hypothetical_protein n=1 Tax=Hexamita inflata TaxID=28002 RepID=A0AA86PMU6_9EUKA|nr:Hypothetical protein HINF_LOCUS28767 [Hexamita inflata]
MIKKFSNIEISNHKVYVTKHEERFLRQQQNLLGSLNQYHENIKEQNQQEKLDEEFARSNRIDIKEHMEDSIKSGNAQQLNIMQTALKKPPQIVKVSEKDIVIIQQSRSQPTYNKRSISLPAVKHTRKLEEYYLPRKVPIEVPIYNEIDVTVPEFQFKNGSFNRKSIPKPQPQQQLSTPTRKGTQQNYKCYSDNRYKHLLKQTPLQGMVSNILQSAEVNNSCFKSIKRQYDVEELTFDIE